MSASQYAVIDRLRKLYTVTHEHVTREAKMSVNDWQVEAIQETVAIMSPGQLHQVLNTIRNRYARLAAEQKDKDRNLWRELLGASELVSQACGATDRFVFRERLQAGEIGR